MAQEEFLSQEEIDMLLQSLGKEEGEEEKEVLECEPFDINALERISPTRLIKLEQVINRWISTATTELRGVIFNLDAISLSDMKTEKISDFVLKIPLPSAIAVLSLEGLGGRFYMIIDTKLIYTIISIIFGGPPQPYKIEGRNFTKVELKVINNIVEILVKHLNASWNDLVGRGSIEYQGLEENPRRMITVSANEIVIVATMEVDIEGFKSNIYLALPMKTIEPIRDILRTSESESSEHRRTMLESILGIPVVLEAVFPPLKLTVKEILDLKEGDFIPIDKKAPEAVQITVYGVPMFEGILGESIGKKAIQIVRISDIPLRGLG